MGMQSQQPVFYDTEQGQYYTMKPAADVRKPPFAMTEEFKNSPMGKAMLQKVMDQRSYLGSGTQNTAAINRFIPKTITPQYPEMNMLFPGLNTGLLQGIASSTQPDGAMYGAGRFLSPQTTNTQGT